jgi:hypothetical protein
MTSTVTPDLLALLAVCLMAAMPAAHAADAGARFQVSGEIRPQSLSEDGRFAIGAEVRVTPERSSDDGRFVLKAVNVPEAGCDPLLDLFANGFEG